ncbi:response regulator transcription factor [Mucilaginibacter sp. 21P]|uniref:LytR/AlgR family response regulator transcription factor n=1 Tax=Mucilaginibacter sp. 21P TaxID=2778902 RepID=UPI001C57AB22|nr:LytTR family DNA-binding domain-containing protein [Mucilaginibacter sp. 21P]QXV63742.1 response regulator transcription factor [Mucilaginibacter sp. 21P]
MTRSVFILDDEPFAVKALQSYVKQTSGLRLAGSDTNPMQAIAKLEQAPPDILLIDVDMPQISGLEIACSLKKEIAIIFITAFKEFSFDAFELSAVDYLLKPISYARFLQAIEKVKRSHFTGPTPADSSIIVKGDAKHKFHKILLSDIIYINAAVNYVQIHCKTETIMTYLTIGELMDSLPPTTFVKVHRSYVINSDYLRTVEPDHVKMTTGQNIPIGVTFRPLIVKLMSEQAVISRRSHAD